MKRAKLAPAPGSGAQPAAGSGFVACPVCKKSLSLKTAQHHIDLCLEGMAAPTRAAAPSSALALPPGLSVVPNFLSVDEEQFLLRYLARQTWSPSAFNVMCDSVVFGEYRSASWQKPGRVEMPPEFDFVIERFRQRPELAAWRPNNANANRYTKSRNHFLRPHVDDRMKAGDIIVNVSLCSDAVMTFAKMDGLLSFDVLLARRSASIMAYASRWEYTHEIKMDNFLGETRISINFRQTRDW